jgi:hypothetical protein
MELYSSNLIILFPVACSLYIAMRLADARAESQQSGVTRAVIYTVIGLMISISTIGLLLRISPLNLIWLVGFAVVVGIVLAKSRILGRTAMLLSFISLGESAQPMRMAADFVRLNSGIVRRRAKMLQRELALGKSVIGSLESARIPRTDHEILWCRLVSKYGFSASQELPTSLHPLTIQTEIERQLSRLLVLPWLMQGIPVVLLIIFFVMPTVRDITVEFGLPQAQTMTYVRTLNQIMSFPLNLAVSVLVLLAMVVSGFIMLVVAMPQLIHVFPIRLLFSSYHRANSLVGLTVAGRREQDLVQACRVASQLVASPDFSRRFELAAERMSGGMAPPQALAESHVLSKPEASRLVDSIHSRSLAWTLQQITLAQTQRMLRRLSGSIQVFLVGIVLLFAGLYGFLAYVLLDFISQTILQISR